MIFGHSTSRNKKIEGRRGWAEVFGFAQPTAKRPDPFMVKLGIIGRGHSGKSALVDAVYADTLTASLPSGLALDVDGTWATTKAVREVRTIGKLLREHGLPPTTEADHREIVLFQGDEKRVRLGFRDEVGQVLTHTTAQSDDAQKARYNAFIDHLASVDVIWMVTALPPSGSGPADIERYRDELRLVRAYFREGLTRRKNRRPCSVGFVLTRLDTVFSSADEARARLSTEQLTDLLKPVLDVAITSPKVGQAVISPVTSFGFGTAVIKSRPDDLEDNDENLNGAEADPPDVASLECGELEWVLRPDASLTPFNITPLVVWSVLTGLLYQEVEVSDDSRSAEPEMAGICRQLGADLEALDGWLIPVKGNLLSSSR